VLSHVETSLGLEPGWCGSSEQAKTFLYVSGDKIQAALVAEPVRVGYRTVVTKTDARENEMDSDGKTHRPCTDKARTAVGSWTVLRKGDVSVRATLGVRAVWTHPDCRRRGIGKRLFETARHALISGYVCALSECAFTQPTESGTSFARSVCGEEDGTFLVYE
jgi:GNAT superfamily N-acetyltransferase